ncbi:MAG: hypothetical protein EP329_17215 [Deltaproteobacteria bacterium]|nr:MAG: hypothetical protein EP329_17215 [Deltaproteobacteria bacterium]
MQLRRATYWLLGLAALLAACGDEVQGGAILPALQVTRVGPSPVVPGTRISIEGGGFVVPAVASLAVIFRGAVDGEATEFAVFPERVDDHTLVVAVEGEVAQALIRPNGRFAGTVSVLRTPLIDAPAEEIGTPVDLFVAQRLIPSLTGYSPTTLYVGEEITLTGEGFLHPSEGASLVELDGTMETDQPPHTVAISGLQLPAMPPDAGRRDALSFTLTPDVLGILPGRFSGTLRVINVDRQDQHDASTPLSVADLTLASPEITAMTPLAASRGQWVMLEGHGFTAADGLLQAATIIEFDGVFTAIDGTAQDLGGPRALTLVPDVVMGNSTIGAVLRVDVDADGVQRGLGLVPGLFEGTVAPIVLFGADQTRGRGLPVSFTVLPQKQVIYIKLLPAFDQALSEFGLLAERDAVIARIREVVRRDYEGISIAFTTEEPEDYAEYGVVEVAGYDPNGTHQFGLDNTSGKDVGNIRFNDIIGGYNAETEADGYAAYGGVFPAEFFNLSPSLADNPLASSRFDDVFRAVMPRLGGTPASPGEAASFARDGAVAEAVQVFGNLVGNTITHEVGHSLGLAAVDGQFHNIGDNPGWIMDAGSARPFEERAEIDGAGPGVFSPQNRAYLERVLPL